ncbi:NUDT19 [Bugula neritina]|uniref:NUDT19 n=1 Tax=Bugula neritina TaxID=10212 RepID=A0A7J7K1Y6_BUGNE|nr:NUDT19 [Bugula neritina]
MVGKLRVAPPQLYELSRLLNFQSLDELRHYTKTRNRWGTERMFPVGIRCLDGAIRVLPGDSLYPEQPDLIGTAPPIDSCSKLTVDQCMMQYPHHHRIVLKSDSNRPVIKIWHKPPLTV